MAMTEKPSPRRSVLTPALEDYLKTIYKLQQESGGAVSTGALAKAMHFAPASTTNMAKRLAKLGLVEYEAYQGLRLTEAGRSIALEAIRHYRLLKLYLWKELGYQWDMVHEEAERLEHHISETFEGKLDELLGYPTHDFHGHPIPTPEGEVSEVQAEHLADVEVGRQVVIRHLSDEDPALLGHLEERGLMPGVVLEVVEKAPFEGPLMVHAGDERQIIGHAVARIIFVSPAE